MGVFTVRLSRGLCFYLVKLFAPVSLDARLQYAFPLERGTEGAGMDDLCDLYPVAKVNAFLGEASTLEVTENIIRAKQDVVLKRVLGLDCFFLWKLRTAVTCEVHRTSGRSDPLRASWGREAHYSVCLTGFVHSWAERVSETWFRAFYACMAEAFGCPLPRELANLACSVPLGSSRADRLKQHQQWRVEAHVGDARSRRYRPRFTPASDEFSMRRGNWTKQWRLRMQGSSQLRNFALLSPEAERARSPDPAGDGMKEGGWNRMGEALKNIVPTRAKKRGQEDRCREDRRAGGDRSPRKGRRASQATTRPTKAVGEAQGPRAPERSAVTEDHGRVPTASGGPISPSLPPTEAVPVGSETGGDEASDDGSRRGLANPGRLVQKLGFHVRKEEDSANDEGDESFPGTRLHIVGDDNAGGGGAFPGVREHRVPGVVSPRGDPQPKNDADRRRTFRKFKSSEDLEKSAIKPRLPRIGRGRHQGSMKGSRGDLITSPRSHQGENRSTSPSRWPEKDKQDTISTPKLFVSTDATGGHHRQQHHSLSPAAGVSPTAMAESPSHPPEQRSLEGPDYTSSDEDLSDFVQVGVEPRAPARGPSGVFDDVSLEDSDGPSPREPSFPPQQGVRAKRASESSARDGASTWAFRRPDVRNRSRSSRAPSRQRPGFAEETDEHVAHDPEARNEAVMVPAEVTYGKVLKSGFLWKKGAVYKAWKRRYFTLHEEYLCYYPDAKTVCPTSAINLRHSCVEYSEESPGNGNVSKHKYTFQISHPDRARVYHLRADSKDGLAGWVTFLNEAIAALHLRS